MNFKQTHGKDALYYLITQKHELMAKATFDHDYLALILIHPAGTKIAYVLNRYCIHHVAPSQTNMQLESPHIFKP